MIKVKIAKNINVEGAIVVILDTEDNVLLLKRPQWVKWAPGKWAFPGGKLEEGESPLEAAIRETKEETSLEVTNLHLISPAIDKPVTTYYTREYRGDVEIDWEHDAWAWVAPANIEKHDLAPDVLEMYSWALKNG